MEQKRGCMDNHRKTCKWRSPVDPPSPPVPAHWPSAQQDSTVGMHSLPPNCILKGSLKKNIEGGAKPERRQIQYKVMHKWLKTACPLGGGGRANGPCKTSLVWTLLTFICDTTSDVAYIFAGQIVFFDVHWMAGYTSHISEYTCLQKQRWRATQGVTLKYTSSKIVFMPQA